MYVTTYLYLPLCVTIHLIWLSKHMLIPMPFFMCKEVNLRPVRAGSHGSNLTRKSRLSGVESDP